MRTRLIIIFGILLLTSCNSPQVQGWGAGLTYHRSTFGNPIGLKMIITDSDTKYIFYADYEENTSTGLSLQISSYSDQISERETLILDKLQDLTMVGFNNRFPMNYQGNDFYLAFFGKYNNTGGLFRVMKQNPSTITMIVIPFDSDESYKGKDIRVGFSVEGKMHLALISGNYATNEADIWEEETFMESSISTIFGIKINTNDEPIIGWANTTAAYVSWKKNETWRTFQVGNEQGENTEIIDVNTYDKDHFALLLKVDSTEESYQVFVCDGNSLQLCDIHTPVNEDEIPSSLIRSSKGVYSFSVATSTSLFMYESGCEPLEMMRGDEPLGHALGIDSNDIRHSYTIQENFTIMDNETTIGPSLDDKQTTFLQVPLFPVILAVFIILPIIYQKKSKFSED